MKRLSILVTLLFLFPLLVSSQQITDDPEARKIFEELDRRREQITWEKSDMKMVIYDSRGRTRNRSIQSYNYNEGSISKSLLIFESPANVKGTAFLTIDQGKEELQKLFLPALNKVQIISASEKSDRFMGSDFTYEDLGDQDPEDYVFELKEQRDTSFVLLARKTEKSQYDRLIFYIDSEKYAIQRVEYFDVQDAMIKRLVASDYQQVLEEVWRPNAMVMYDLENDRKTELAWSNRVIGEPIPEWRFTERGLRRGVR
ncbi:MAG: outer membrane lipoprotein-sorting protein [Balneolaceae bacterium]|nr:outer membrane lipoprotein-sorting protein [Balneolaceae bacterium]